MLIHGRYFYTETESSTNEKTQLISRFKVRLPKRVNKFSWEKLQLHAARCSWPWSDGAVWGKVVILWRDGKVDG